MKKVFKIVFFVALALFLLFGAISIISIISAQNIPSSSVGIIGGADGPTAILVTQTLVFKTVVFQVLCILLLVLVVSAVGFIITRKK